MKRMFQLNAFSVSARAIGLVIVMFAAFLQSPAGMCAAMNYQVKGEVVDSAGVAEVYATLRIFSAADSVKPVVLGTTDENGLISQTLPSAGEYRLAVASVGKQPFEKTFAVSASEPIADLGRLVLNENVTELGQVEVVAQRPLVVREIDRLGYDVKADPEAETSTLREILRKVPLVSVDEEGNIKVK